MTAELVDLPLVAYLLAAIGLLLVPVLKSRDRRLKALYGFRFKLTNQCIGFLILWAAGEIAEITIPMRYSTPLHFIAMLSFAVYVTYSFGSFLNRIERPKQ